MLLIWGFKRYVATLAILSLACRNGHVAAHRLAKSTRKFTLFFIPLFPVGTKYFTVCTQCGTTVQWSKADAEIAAGNAAPLPASGADPVSAPVAMQSSPPAAALPPAAWYADPDGSGGQRWWDGSRWTDQTSGRPQLPG